MSGCFALRGLGKAKCDSVYRIIWSAMDPRHITDILGSRPEETVPTEATVRLDTSALMRSEEKRAVPLQWAKHG
jgi:hypothetical protein